MSEISLLALMREATRRVEMEIESAMLIQVTGGELAPVPTSFQFTFKIAGENATAVITYEQGSWGSVVRRGPILGLVFDDLLRCEIDIEEAIELIRKAGYEDPVYMCGLFQALTRVPTIYPRYNFTPDNCGWNTSDHYIFVDAVTGEVLLFPEEEEG